MKQVLIGATLSIDADLLGVRPTSGKEWVTAAEAAAALRVSGRHIRRLCITGQIRHKRVGKLYRIHVSELSLVDQQRTSPAKPTDAATSPRGPAEAEAQPGRPPGEGWVQRRRGGPWTRPGEHTPEQAAAYRALAKIGRNKSRRW